MDGCVDTERRQCRRGTARGRPNVERGGPPTPPLLGHLCPKILVPSGSSSPGCACQRGTARTATVAGF
eukprot:1193180-Prorocentrum_minimum.AAC.1